MEVLRRWNEFMRLYRILRSFHKPCLFPGKTAGKTCGRHSEWRNIDLYKGLKGTQL